MMDNVGGFEDDRAEDGDDLLVAEPEVEIGGDERRMHVRAYNHWVALLQGRAYPPIQDLDPGNIVDFGPHSVLLDFSRGLEDPAIAYLGGMLREECALDTSVKMISQVPSRSLLSRLTDHYLQIIANRAPIGFEAEFVSSRGFNTMYRGILMPFSSDGETIDFIYGVINWKELVDAETQAKLDAEVAASVRTAPRSVASAPVWADGPSAERDDSDEFDVRIAGNLADQLMLAQQTAAAVRAADTRSRATLYRALGRAHDFATAADQDPTGYEALLAKHDITLQLRAPMTPITKLVFGKDYDKTRLTEYATVLNHARRLGVVAGGLSEFLDGFDGGIKGVVKAERDLRQPAGKATVDHRAALADRPTLAEVVLDVGAASGDYVVLLARAGAGGALQIVAALDDQALTEKAIRAAV